MSGFGALLLFPVYGLDYLRSYEWAPAFLTAALLYVVVRLAIEACREFT